MVGIPKRKKCKTSFNSSTAETSNLSLKHSIHAGVNAVFGDDVGTGGEALDVYVRKNW